MKYSKICNKCECEIHFEVKDINETCMFKKGDIVKCDYSMDRILANKISDEYSVKEYSRLRLREHMVDEYYNDRMFEYKVDNPFKIKTIQCEVCKTVLFVERISRHSTYNVENDVVGFRLLKKLVNDVEEKSDKLLKPFLKKHFPKKSDFEPPKKKWWGKLYK